MDNQHQKISGYRDLSQAEIDLMNSCKALEAQCGELIGNLQTSHDVVLDQRCVALARTKLQEGFMWAVRSIAQPDSKL